MSYHVPCTAHHNHSAVLFFFVRLRTSFHTRVASLNRTPPTTHPTKTQQPTSLHEIHFATLQLLHACPMRHGDTEWERSFSKSKLSTIKHGRHMDGRPMRYNWLLSSLYMPAQRDTVAPSKSTRSPNPSRKCAYYVSVSKYT